MIPDRNRHLCGLVENLDAVSFPATEVIDLLTSANDENRSVPVMPRTDTHKVAPLVAPTSVEEKQQAASNR